MPRRSLKQTAGTVFHVLNRGVRRLRLFDQPSDYEAFLRTLAEARARVDLRLLAYCVMPNHYHLVVWPSEDGQMSTFMWWFQTTHSKRWHGFRRSHGTGSVYQGRFHAFAVQSDRHFLTVCRYVERNALRAGLVERAEDWRWCSLAQRCKKLNAVRLDGWPVVQPEDWVERVNTAETPGELVRIRRSVLRDAPFGGEAWAVDAARQLGSLRSVRPLGRPVKRRTPGVIYAPRA